MYIMFPYLASISLRFFSVTILNIENFPKRFFYSVLLKTNFFFKNLEFLLIFLFLDIEHSRVLSTPLVFYLLENGRNLYTPVVFDLVPLLEDESIVGADSRQFVQFN